MFATNSAFSRGPNAVEISHNGDLPSPPASAEAFQLIKVPGAHGVPAEFHDGIHLQQNRSAFLCGVQNGVQNQPPQNASCASITEPAAFGSHPTNSENPGVPLSFSGRTLLFGDSTLMSSFDQQHRQNAETQRFPSPVSPTKVLCSQHKNHRMSPENRPYLQQQYLQSIISSQSITAQLHSPQQSQTLQPQFVSSHPQQQLHHHHHHHYLHLNQQPQSPPQPHCQQNSQLLQLHCYYQQQHRIQQILIQQQRQQHEQYQLHQHRTSQARQNEELLLAKAKLQKQEDLRRAQLQQRKQQQQQQHAQQSRPGSAAQGKDAQKETQSKAQLMTQALLKAARLHFPAELTADYEIGARLGAGGYGAVFAGTRRRDGMRVAVKAMPKVNVPLWRCTEDPVLGLVPTEAAVLNRLRHRNIIEFVECREGPEFFYLVMELHGNCWSKPQSSQLPSKSCPSSIKSTTPANSDCDDSEMLPHDLFEFIEKNNLKNEEMASHIFAQIVAALNHMHMCGYAHRDIKDENVVIDTALRVKVIDLGSATKFPEPGTCFKRYMGTLQYCPPELLSSTAHTGAPQDVWQLGVLLFIMLFREHAFTDAYSILDHIRVIKTSPPKHISFAVIDILARMLHPNPDLRPTTSQILAHRWLERTSASRMYFSHANLRRSAFAFNNREIAASAQRGDIASEVL